MITTTVKTETVLKALNKMSAEQLLEVSTLSLCKATNTAECVLEVLMNYGFERKSGKLLRFDANNRLEVIKKIKSILGIDLKEAKEFVDACQTEGMRIPASFNKSMGEQKAIQLFLDAGLKYE